MFDFTFSKPGGGLDVAAIERGGWGEWWEKTEIVTLRVRLFRGRSLQ